MLPRCVPASAKRVFMLCCLIIFQKAKQDRLCHLAVPVKHLPLQHRAYHCQGCTLPPYCLSSQAEDSLWVGKINQKRDEVKIFCPSKILLMDVCKGVWTNNCKGGSKIFPYWTVLSWLQFSTALLCSFQRHEQVTSSLDSPGLRAEEPSHTMNLQGWVWGPWLWPNVADQVPLFKVPLSCTPEILTFGIIKQSSNLLLICWYKCLICSALWFSCPFQLSDC